MSAGSVSAHLRGEAALLEREDHQLDALRLEEERLVGGRVQRAAEAVIHVLDQLSLLKGLPREDASVGVRRRPPSHSPSWLGPSADF